MFSPSPKNDGHFHARCSEFETENNLKLRSQYITFTNNLNLYSTKFQGTMQQLLLTYEQLKAEIANEQDRSTTRTDQIQEEYNALQHRTEVAYEEKMMEMVVL